MNNYTLEHLESKLLPCPCCGGKAKIKVIDNTNDKHMEEYDIAMVYIKCTSCGLESGTYSRVLKTKMEIGEYIGSHKYDMIFKVINKWNKRPKSKPKKFVNGFCSCPCCGGKPDLKISFINHIGKPKCIINSYNGKCTVNSSIIAIDGIDYYTVVCNSCYTKLIKSAPIGTPAITMCQSLYQWNVRL